MGPGAILLLGLLSLARASDSTERKALELSSALLRMPAKSPYDEHYDALDFYHFPGVQKAPHRLFTSVCLVVELADEKWRNDQTGPGYEIYQSWNRSEVEAEAAANRRFLGWFRRVAVWKSRQLAPFRHSWIGLESNEAYAIHVRITNVNYLYLGLFTLGLVGFVTAPKLTRHAAFYYTTGTGVGLIASLLILVFVLYKVLPKRSVAYSVLIGGWSFSFYLLYALWQNLYTVLLQYQKYLAAYLVTVVLVSFAVCYRVGPPRDPRSVNLLQWTLQFVSLCLVFGGCQIPEMGLAICALLLIARNIPKGVVDRGKRVWHYIFPARRKLLSEAEFEREGREATAKALRDLREYCRSPDCNSWRTMSRLRSPQRMAEFVDGASHINDSELLAYDVDASHSEDEVSDGLSDSDSDDQSVRVVRQKIDAQFTSFYSPPADTGRVIRSEGRGKIPALSRVQNGHLNTSLPLARKPRSSPSKAVSSKKGSSSRRRSPRGLDSRGGIRGPMPAYDEISDDEA